jgi:hypothetical protein
MHHAESCAWQRRPRCRRSRDRGSATPPNSPRPRCGASSTTETTRSNRRQRARALPPALGRAGFDPRAARRSGIHTTPPRDVRCRSGATGLRTDRPRLDVRRPRIVRAAPRTARAARARRHHTLKRGVTVGRWKHRLLCRATQFFGARWYGHGLANVRHWIPQVGGSPRRTP